MAAQRELEAEDGLSMHTVEESCCPLDEFLGQTRMDRRSVFPALNTSCRPDLRLRSGREKDFFFFFGQWWC